MHNVKFLDKLSVNKKVIINKDDSSYLSLIQDINDDYLLIDVPYAKGEYLHSFKEGDAIEIDYYNDNSYFRFKVKVIARQKENGIPVYKVTVPEEIKKVERRDFVRIDILENVFYNKNDKWNKAVLLDLSGGGMRIRIKEDIEVGDKIQVNLFIDEEKIQVNGVIVRVIQNEDKENICGLEFIDIDERKRDKIIEKIFLEMRRQIELV